MMKRNIVMSIEESKDKFVIVKYCFCFLFSILLSILVIIFSILPIYVTFLANYISGFFVFAVLTMMVGLLIYINWAIWTKGVFRKLCIPVVLIIFCFVGVIVFPDIPELRSDYCIEDGECEEGRVIWHDDEEILINKENCLKYNWVWHDEKKYCDVN